MKYPNLHDLSKRAAALVLTAALLVPSAFASAGTTRLSTSRTLADGLTYINTISEHPSSGRIESFSFQLEPGSDVTRPVLRHHLRGRHHQQGGQLCREFGIPCGGRHQ